MSFNPELISSKEVVLTEILGVRNYLIFEHSVDAFQTNMGLLYVYNTDGTIVNNMAFLNGNKATSGTYSIMDTYNVTINTEGIITNIDGSLDSWNQNFLIPRVERKIYKYRLSNISDANNKIIDETYRLVTMFSKLTLYGTEIIEIDNSGSLLNRNSTWNDLFIWNDEHIWGREI